MALILITSEDNASVSCVMLSMSSPTLRRGNKFGRLAVDSMGGSRKNFREVQANIVGIKVAQLNVSLELQLRTLLVISEVPV